MRRAVTVFLACLVGVHCAAPAAGDAADVTAPDAPGRVEAPADGPPIVPHQGSMPRAESKVGDEQLLDGFTDVLASGNAHVSSFVEDSDGATYAAGTYEGTLVVGENVLHSRGGDDVFLLRTEADGRVGWVISVGSEGRERAPRVSLDAADQNRVKLLGTSDGEMNCGSGPMATWTGTSTFFLCVFEGFSGATLASGAFPVAP